MEINNEGKSFRCRKIVNIVKREWVLIFTIVGIIVGFIIGLLIRPLKPSDGALMWIGMPGDIFLSLVKLIIIPLIVASIISGTSSSDPKVNGKITGLSLAYIFITNLFGCVIGLFLGAVVEPGKDVSGNNGGDAMSLNTDLETQDMMADLIRNIFPENIFQATIQTARTKYVEVNTTVGNETVPKRSRTLIYIDSSNPLGLVFISIVFGIATGYAKEKGKTVKRFFTSLNNIVMIVIKCFMWMSPVGVTSLMARTIGRISDIREVFIKLGVLIGSVTGGCLFYQIILIPLFIVITTRKSPLPVLLKTGKPWFVAFATTSEAVSAPAIFEACDKLRIDKRISGVSVPLAVVLNRNNSALFVCICSLFLARISQISISNSETIVIGVVTWVAVFTVPAIPMGSMVTIVIVCGTVGIPVENIGLLIAVEWYQDRLRTAGNVQSIVTCSYIINCLCGSSSQGIDRDLDERNKTRREVSSRGKMCNGKMSMSEVTRL